MKVEEFAQQLQDIAERLVVTESYRREQEAELERAKEEEERTLDGKSFLKDEKKRQRSEKLKTDMVVGRQKGIARCTFSLEELDRELNKGKRNGKLLADKLRKENRKKMTVLENKRIDRQKGLDKLLAAETLMAEQKLKAARRLKKEEKVKTTANIKTADDTIQARQNHPRQREDTEDQELRHRLDTW